MIEVGYEFYQNTYMGTLIPEEVFGSFAYRAGILLSSMVRGGENLDSSDKVLYLLCQICDRLFQEDRKRGISHESVDGYSVTYEKGEMPGDIKHLVQTYLGTEGVLFRGRKL